MNTENSFSQSGSKNDFFRFLEMKTGKLVTAVYMVTNFLSDKEPIKWKLRDVCLSLLSCSSVLKEKNSVERSNLLSEILTSAEEVLSLLEIAHFSGFISEMNYTVLKREYTVMIEHVAGRKEIKNSLSKVSIPEAFFSGIDYRPIATGSGKGARQLGAKTMGAFPKTEQLKTIHDASEEFPFTRLTRMSRLKDSQTVENQRGDVFLNDLDYKDMQGLESRTLSGNDSLSRVETVKIKRQENILKMLKDNSDLTIKDMAGKITDCSEKTIQRELVALVKNGIIKRTGERRWSRYSLA